MLRPRSKPHSLIIVNLILALAAGGALAQGGPCDVRLLNGGIVSGDLRSIENGKIFIDEAGSARVLEIHDCISIQMKRSDSKADADRKDPFFVNIQFDGGDGVCGVAAGGSGEKLQLSLGGQPLSVPVDAIRKLTFPARVPAQILDFAANAGGDRIYQIHRNDASADPTVEPINGTLVSFGEKSLQFDGVLGSKSYAYESLAAVLITPLGKPAQTRVEPDAVVTFAPDGRLQMKLTKLASGAFIGESNAIGKCNIPARAVSGIRFRNSQFADLADLDPVEVNESAWFGGAASVRYPWKRNRNVTGGPLRVGGVLYDSGIGAHSRCLLTYDLGGKYESFRAFAGLDDETIQLARKGSVIFRVHVDGRKEYESPIVRSGDRALEITNINLHDRKKLTLEVDFADGFDIADRADWCDAILLRSPAPPPGK
ncbi:MAG: NPCBM/NEW2 domain-containing protein [Planctomycetes bacterium]|nr:NPCBM/NEW2 domain-containing protein [Planctomycetota bacterium]